MPSLATASEQNSNAFGGVLLLLLPLLLFGFLIWSQRRRAKQFQQAQAELRVGQDVATTSGLLGTLVGLDDDTAEIEAAPGVRLRFDRRAVVPSSVVQATADRPADREAEQAPGPVDQTPGQAPQERPDQTPGQPTDRPADPRRDVDGREG